MICACFILLSGFCWNPPHSCRDQNVHCKYWANIGECKNNPAYMLVYCPIACKQCVPTTTANTPTMTTTLTTITTLTKTTTPTSTFIFIMKSKDFL